MYFYALNISKKLSPNGTRWDILGNLNVNHLKHKKEQTCSCTDVAHNIQSQPPLKGAFKHKDVSALKRNNFNALFVHLPTRSFALNWPVVSKALLL